MRWLDRACCGGINFKLQSGQLVCYKKRPSSCAPDIEKLRNCSRRDQLSEIGVTGLEEAGNDITARLNTGPITSINLFSHAVSAAQLSKVY